MDYILFLKGLYFDPFSTHLRNEFIDYEKGKISERRCLGLYDGEKSDDWLLVVEIG